MHFMTALEQMALEGNLRDMGKVERIEYVGRYRMHVDGGGTAGYQCGTATSQ